MATRAKFRCMSITQHAQHATTLEFLPVMSKCHGYPEGSEENTAFWEATPSGKASLTHQGEVPFKVGDFYYIDLVEAAKAPGIWKLWQISLTKDSMKVSLSTGWNSDYPIHMGTLEMGIHNKKAWPAFEGKVDTNWSVTFTPAPFTDAPTAGS